MSGRMVMLLSALLAVSAAEPVEVRVRDTAGGPRVFVDGQPTAARMFWGLDNQKRRELTADWRRYRLKVTPPADAGMVKLTLNPDPGCRGRVEVRGVDTNALLRAEKGKTLEVSFEARSVGGMKGFRPALQQVTSGVYEYHGVLDLPPDDPEESNLISQSRGARAAGIRFISFFAPNAFADCGEPIDFAAWDSVVDRLIAAVPDALVIPRVTVNPPARWFERHPDARIDMTCETPVGIWLIEFKLDRPAEEALAQIDERNYADKYDFAGKAVRKLGISFSSEKRTIVDAKVG